MTANNEKYADIVRSKAENRRIYIFGAGETGKKILDWFIDKKEITGFIDNNPALTGKNAWGGIPVYRPGDAAIANGTAFVLIASVVPGHINAMRGDCASAGYPCMTYQELAIAAHNDITDIWHDDESRNVYKALVQFMSSQRHRDLPQMTGEQYFQPFIPNRCYRSFVDGGAFVGDTFKRFRRLLKNDFDTYWAFEPNKQVFTDLLAAIDGDERIKAYNAALSDTNGVSYFLHGEKEYGSRLSPLGEEAVECVCLDDIIKDEAPGFIKLDVEGAEPEALAGAAKTIAAAKPALAVCVYHDPFHLWTVPAAIKKLLPNSKLFLRHHSNTKFETVCYALPGS